MWWTWLHGPWFYRSFDCNWKTAKNHDVNARQWNWKGIIKLRKSAFLPYSLYMIYDELVCFRPRWRSRVKLQNFCQFWGHIRNLGWKLFFEKIFYVSPTILKFSSPNLAGPYLYRPWNEKMACKSEFCRNT